MEIIANGITKGNAEPLKGGVRITQAKAPANTALPDLDKINIPELDADKARAEAEKAKEWAEAAGGKLADIEAKIAALESDPNIRFSKQAQDNLVALKAAKAKIMSVGNEAVVAHAKFAQLLEEVRRTERSQYAVRGMLLRLVEEGRYRFSKPGGEVKGLPRDSRTRKIKWPAGTIFFFDMLLFSCRGEGGEASNGHKALEAEVRRMVDEAKAVVVAHMKDETYANHDLSGLKSLTPGQYYVYVPARERFGEGHLIIDVRDRNAGVSGKKPFEMISIVEAMGSCSALVTGAGRKSIPGFWLAKGEIITGTRPDGSKKFLQREDFDRSIRILRTLQAGIAHWENPPAEEVVEPNPEPEPKKRATKKAAKKAEAADAPAGAPAEA